MRSFRRILFSVFVAAGGLAVADKSDAQTYPSKPMRFVIPFPAGSTGELAMRPVGERIQAALGQPFIIEPRPGGGGLVAMRYVTSQPADGYTLAYYSSSAAIKSAIPHASFDARKDLTHISGLFGAPPMLGINFERIPVASIRELIALAKTRPGKLNFANYGYGTTGHLVSVFFAQKAGIDVVHVPYQGTAEVQRALVSGEADLAFTSKASLQTRPDKVRMLAVSTAERDALSPDIPGMRESGLGDFDINVIISLAAPAGLPGSIVRTLNSSVNAALRDPGLQATFTKMGLTPNPTTPEQIVAYVTREVETMAKIVRDGNLKIE